MIRLDFNLLLDFVNFNASIIFKTKEDKEVDVVVEIYEKSNFMYGRLWGVLSTSTKTKTQLGILILFGYVKKINNMTNMIRIQKHKNIIVT